MAALAQQAHLERVNGNDPSYRRRQRRALPLSYTRNNLAGKPGLEPGIFSFKARRLAHSPTYQENMAAQSRFERELAVSETAVIPARPSGSKLSKIWLREQDSNLRSLA